MKTRRAQKEVEMFTRFAVNLAKRAGAILLEDHRKRQRRIYKLPTDFKLPTDDKVDRMLFNTITKRFPDHGIRSEENEIRPAQNGSLYEWCNDPLDGTVNFASGALDLFATSIALALNGVPIIGVINAPLCQGMYVAQVERGATLNGKSIRVSQQSDLNKATIQTEFGKLRRTDILAHYPAILGPQGILYPYTFGCSSVSLALVAQGARDAFFSLDLEPWDMAAGVVLIREAGGKATNARGEEWKLGDTTILAANPILHQKLFEFLGLGS